MTNLQTLIFSYAAFLGILVTVFAGVGAIAYVLTCIRKATDYPDSYHEPNEMLNCVKTEQDKEGKQ